MLMTLRYHGDSLSPLTGQNRHARKIFSVQVLPHDPMILNFLLQSSFKT